MERDLVEELRAVYVSLFGIACMIRGVCDGRRGPAWRVLSATATSVEMAGHTVRSLCQPAEDASDAPAFTPDDLREKV